MMDNKRSPYVTYVLKPNVKKNSHACGLVEYGKREPISSTVNIDSWHAIWSGSQAKLLHAMTPSMTS